jgi:hypothetical protein
LQYNNAFELTSNGQGCRGSDSVGLATLCDNSWGWAESSQDVSGDSNNRIRLADGGGIAIVGGRGNREEPGGGDEGSEGLHFYHEGFSVAKVVEAGFKGDL